MLKNFKNRILLCVVLAAFPDSYASIPIQQVFPQAIPIAVGTAQKEGKLLSENVLHCNPNNLPNWATCPTSQPTRPTRPTAQKTL